MFLTAILIMWSAMEIMGHTTKSQNKLLEEATESDKSNTDIVFPDDDPNNSVISYQKKSLPKHSRVLRGPVNHTVELSTVESCVGWPDGTKCTKRCLDISCDPLQARCWQGHCKRSGRHPCDITGTHPCCCGDCNKDTTDPANHECFANFLHIKHEHPRKKKKKNIKTKKNDRSKINK